MKTSIRILSLAVLALTMAACSNDTEQPTAIQTAPGNAGEGIPFSATISTGSATTRALTEEKGIISSTWAKDEQVALIHNGVVDVMTAGEPDENGNVTITGTLSVTPEDNDDVTVVYPASAVDKDEKAVKPSLLTTQDGTLTNIATSLNLRQSNGATFKVGELTATLNGTVTLANQIAIVKFSLSDGNNALAAKQFVIKDGSDNVLTTVTPLTPASDLYVAMAPATNAAAFKFEATVGDFTYTYEKSGVTLEASTYYQSPITLDVVEHDMEVSASGFSGTYDGWSHGISVTAPDDATVKYGTAANACDLDNSPKYTNAGTYTIYYEVTKDKYTTVTGSATVKIYKAAGSISYSETTAVHMVSDVAFKNPLTLSGTASVSYSSNDINVATVAADGTVTIRAKGTATITATVTSSTNYSYSPDYAQYTLIVHSPTAVGPSGGYEDGGVDPINNH